MAGVVATPLAVATSSRNRDKSASGSANSPESNPSFSRAGSSDRRVSTTKAMSSVRDATDNFTVTFVMQ
jgi:hypothetical protein